MFIFSVLCVPTNTKICDTKNESILIKLIEFQAFNNRQLLEMALKMLDLIKSEGLWWPIMRCRLPSILYYSHLGKCLTAWPAKLKMKFLALLNTLSFHPTLIQEYLKASTLHSA